MVWVLCNSILSFYTYETLEKYNVPVRESSIWNYTAPKLAPTSPENPRSDDASEPIKLQTGKVQTDL